MDDVPVPQVSASADYLIDALQVAAVDGAVCIQPRVYGRDHRYLLHALKEHRDRLRGVCLVDPANAQADKDVKMVTQMGDITGVRFVTLELRNPSAILGAGLDLVWRTIEDRALVASILLDPWQFRVIDLAARRFPSVNLVVDHLGRIDAANWRRYVDELTVLGRLRNVHVKMSAVGLLSRAPWPYDDMRHVIERVLAAFGPERVLWGSDFPHVLEVDPYAASISALWSLLPDLADDERALVVGGNASRLYGI